MTLQTTIKWKGHLIRTCFYRFDMEHARMQDVNPDRRLLQPHFKFGVKRKGNTNWKEQDFWLTHDDFLAERRVMSPADTWHMFMLRINKATEYMNCSGNWDQWLKNNGFMNHITSQAQRLRRGLERLAQVERERSRRRSTQPAPQERIVFSTTSTDGWIQVTEGSVAPDASITHSNIFDPNQECWCTDVPDEEIVMNPPLKQPTKAEEDEFRKMANAYNLLSNLFDLHNTSVELSKERGVPYVVVDADEHGRA